MKISLDTSTHSEPVAPPERLGIKTAQTAAQKAVNQSSVTLSISSQARDIQKVRAGIASSQEMRSNLVNALKAKVESGAYSVNSEKITNLLIK